jgi:protein-disulfide isomerase
MLAVGIAAGYFGRPLVTPEPLAATPVASAGTSAAADASPDAAALMDAVVAHTRHFKGDPDAPVTIIEFSDFQCPYCGRFATDAGRQIHEQYVETGLVRFGYQHFAFLGPESQKAAEASECAAEQDAFWPYHDTLFGRLTGENQGSLSPAGLSQYAAEVGLDTEAFDACLDSGKYASLVSSETSAAQSLGVTGTPSFLVNGRPLVGAQPFEVFQQVIEAELRAN